MTETAEVQLQILKQLSEMSIELKKLDPLCEKVQKLSVEFSSVSESLNKKICKVEESSEDSVAEVRELKIEVAKNRKIMDLRRMEVQCDSLLYNFDPKFKVLV